MAIFIDRRYFVNGRKSTINLENSLNMNTFIINTTKPQIDGAVTQVTNNINTLKNTLITEVDYTALPNDYRIFTKEVGGAVTITLPDPTTITGKTYFIQASTYVNPVTITVGGGFTINGVVSIILLGQHEYVEVCAIDGKYLIVNSNYTPS